MDYAAVYYMRYIEFAFCATVGLTMAPVLRAGGVRAYVRMKKFLYGSLAEALVVASLLFLLGLVATWQGAPVQ